MIIDWFRGCRRQARVSGPRVRSWMMSANPPVKSYGQSLAIILLDKGYMKHGIAEQNRVRPTVA